MNRINEITYEEIERLDPNQLARLLHALLHAEARSRGILVSSVPFNRQGDKMVKREPPVELDYQVAAAKDRLLLQTVASYRPESARQLPA